jgi:hypothetical protein
MLSEMPLPLLWSTFLLPLLTVLVVTFLFLRFAWKMHQSLVSLQERSLLLLASENAQDFERLDAVVNPPRSSYSESDTYYTGDAKQVEDERLKGLLNDDELTGVYGAGF